MIGDAAMLVGPEPAPVLEAALALVEAAEDEGEDFPLLRAGVARGQALARGGRLVRAPGQPGEPDHRRSPARAASSPASASTRRSPTSYDWSFAGERRLKGIDGRVKLYRCRRRG